MPIRDRVFQSTFSRMFVYNILFEDSEVDERYLGIDEDSTVLSITGAGCGVAGMISKNPRNIDTVDINGHHLALTALKISAARKMNAYVDFYDLFARGRNANPHRTIKRLTSDLPPWIQRYWRLHHRRFNKPYHTHGFTGKVMTALRRRVQTDADFVRQMADTPVTERMKVIDDWFVPVLNKPHVAAFLKSPVQMIGLGVNFEQRDKMLETEGTDLIGFFVNHLRKVAATDLWRNWFAWYVLAGEFNHDRQDAVPPYLRRDRHERSLEASTRVSFHHGNLFDRLNAAGPKTWSHYTLCDAPDWMPASVQRNMLDEIERTARPGATIMVRTVENEGLVERLGLEKRFVLKKDISDLASTEDRSRQYRRVSFYEVAHA